MPRAAAFLLAIPLLACLGCRTGGPHSASADALEPPLLPPEMNRDCGLDGRHIFLQLSPVIFRQGATIAIRPLRDNAPAGNFTLPAFCVSNLSLAGPARFNDDRSAFTIDASAPPGAEIVVGFNLGALRAEHRLRVVAADAVVLTGTRRQTSVEGCEGLTPVGELEFGEDHFAVTFQPFETYKDYWGTYSFDPASGALRMVVTGGNNVPAGIDLEGRARVEGGHVILEDMFLGSPGSGFPATNCRYVF